MGICTNFFVIQMEGSAQRQRNVEALRQALPFDVTIYPAIDGNRITPSALRRLIGAGEIDVLSLRLHMGQLGCALSHIGVWRQLLGSGLDWAVVLEDDARLAPDFILNP
jgi:glycosyl transferase family 25